MSLPSNPIGFHFDIHAPADAASLGEGPTVDELVAMLRDHPIDLVQADCKGHPGFTTWPSRIPEASVPLNLHTDVLRVWREATRSLGLPLHGHYSGIVDAAAAERHPDWCVQAYTTALHKHAPGARICSNWLQSFSHPGQPTVETDWISGDNTWVWALDACRCESRFISTRGKPWDLMIWTFFRSSRSFDPELTWEQKPAEMIMREAATPLALGGGLQLYFLHDKATGHGTPVPWHIEKAAPVFPFAKERQSLCADTETWPQVAVLHSEHHARAHPGLNLMWDVDTASIQGAVWSLLENQLGVDILDEWALLPRLRDFPLVVVPEQDSLSPEMLTALKTYVQKGGRLLISGSGLLDRFGAEFLGIDSHQPAGDDFQHLCADDECARIPAKNWRRITPGNASPLLPLRLSPDLREPALESPGAVLHRVGAGAVLIVPGDLFRFYARSRQSTLRRIIGSLTDTLYPDRELRVSAPPGIDVIFRHKGDDRFIHLINRANGLSGGPDDGTETAIPPVGPVDIQVRLTRPPRNVRLHFGAPGFTSHYENGVLQIRLATLSLHEVLDIEVGGG